MTGDQFPLWAAIAVSVLLVAGSLLMLAGCIGMVRFRSFYQRIHAPTLGTSFGTIFILAGSVVYFTVTQLRPAVHEVLIFVFVSVTTPVTLMLLARAALYRDRIERVQDVPASKDPLDNAEMQTSKKPS
ncbi:monovalent cation/H(+) antiporter subunit G [Oryzicola mucosus]|uniref:Cation:proton antiporter n=1 Tax=Oryzicola mucosus TaxID=2767425 RepID=A0A8J6TWT5_9HYPH|nr:monovalent cation/H(+) antiporter subunit G [Oryzicola mucosus]MBD0414041.1 cation:proton antiporter [Oryzicola mucosus]